MYFYWAGDAMEMLSIPPGSTDVHLELVNMVSEVTLDALEDMNRGIVNDLAPAGQCVTTGDGIEICHSKGDCAGEGPECVPGNEWVSIDGPTPEGYVLVARERGGQDGAEADVVWEWSNCNYDEFNWPPEDGDSGNEWDNCDYESIKLEENHSIQYDAPTSWDLVTIQ